MSGRKRLPILLAVSYGLRVVLASRGGQLFWPDEGRYLSADSAIDSLRHGAWNKAFVELFGHADHVLFRMVGLPVALLQALAGQAHPVWVACYFSLFSVAAIGLLWALARRMGADEGEAFWATLLAASANSLFYYSRHYFPYDVSLALMLFALWVGLRPGSGQRSVFVGLMVGFGFLVYNGYWLLGGVVLCLHTVVGGTSGFRSLARRAVAALAGLVASVAAVIGLGHVASGIALGSYLSFAGTITQGDFGSGYRVAVEYLWSSERCLFWVLLVGSAAGLVTAGRSGGGRRAWVWCLVIVLLFGGLVALSDLTPRLVVYGRLVRTMVPFLCLLAASGINGFVAKCSPRWSWLPLAVGLFLVVLAAGNFRRSFAVVYPDQFRPLARDALSVTKRGHYAFHRALYVGSLWGVDVTGDLPAHTELLREAHPMEFEPYQYEGFSRRARELLRSHDIGMRVVEVGPGFDPAARGWSGYPGPVRMALAFDPKVQGASEPLVASGVIGAGEILFVRYLDGTHVQFGLSRVGADDLVSQPIVIDFSRRHTLVVSLGSFFPPASDPLYTHRPELAAYRGQVIVILDGKTVFSSAASFFPSRIDDLNFGTNLLLFPKIEPNFTGVVDDFGIADEAALGARMPSTAAAAIATARDPLWRGAVGPLRFRLTAPDGPSRGREPILSWVGPRGAEVIYVRDLGAGSVSFGVERSGGSHREGKRLPVNRGEALVIDVVSGSLMPREDAGIYGRWSGFRDMRKRLQVRVGGVVALDLPEEPLECTARQVCLGTNTAGFGDILPASTLQILDIEPLSPENLPEFGHRIKDLVSSPSDAWQGFSGPLRIQLDISDMTIGSEEPLIATGDATGSELLTITRRSRTGIRFALRAGDSLIGESREISVPDERDMELLLALGGLMPPRYGPLYPVSPGALSIKALNTVVVNGKEALLIDHEPLDSEAERAALGLRPGNYPKVRESFDGRVRSISIAPLEDIFAVRRMPLGLGRPEWQGYPGALRMKVVFPPWTAGAGQPLITSGRTGAGDFVYIGYGPDLKAQAGQDHWGSNPSLSGLFDLNTGTVHEVCVSYGALYPPETVLHGASDPRLLPLRDRVIVMIDGRKVLDRTMPSHPSSPGDIYVGANFIGGSSTRPLFDGTISDIESVPLDEVLKW
jgi:hypothetical protein